MLQIWRVEQARSLIALFFWSLALAGIFYERVAWRFREWFGLSPENDVALITFILTIFVVVGIVIFGVAYDRIFRMWEFKSRIVTEKDIFRHGKMNDKEVPIYEELWFPLAKALNNIGEKHKLDPTVRTLERWVKNHEVISYADESPPDHGERAGEPAEHGGTPDTVPVPEKVTIVQNITEYYAAGKVDIKDSVVTKTTFGDPVSPSRQGKVQDQKDSPNDNDTEPVGGENS